MFCGAGGFEGEKYRKEREGDLSSYIYIDYSTFQYRLLYILYSTFLLVTDKSVGLSIIFFLLVKQRQFWFPRFPVQKRDGGIETALLLIYTQAIALVCDL